MYARPEIPDLPDVKQGGVGADRWVELDMYWEAANFCILLDQPERHSPYTRRLDRRRGYLLDRLGIEHVRYSADQFANPKAVAAVRHRVRGRTRRERRVHAREGLPVPAPMMNVTRTLAWLAGDKTALAVPLDWPRHYDRARITWNYDPGDCDPEDLYVGQAAAQAG